MADFLEGDLFVGGNYGYITHYRPVDLLHANLIQHIEVLDDENNQLCPNGIAIGPDGSLYVAQGDPAGMADSDPHDVAYVDSDPPKLAVIIANNNDTAEIRTYDLDGALLDTYSIELDVGWVKSDMLKIDVSCDGTTAYYTDRGKTIFKFDLNTGLQLSPFDQLAESSPYIYADFGLLPETATGGDTLIVNMTSGGTGPRNAIAIGEFGVWSDEINPVAEYKIYLRSLEDGSDITSIQANLDPEGTNDEVTALAIYFNVCVFAGLARLDAVTTNQIWFLDEF